MKVAVGAVFYRFGGVIQHVNGIKKYSSHDISVVPGNFVGSILEKHSNIYTLNAYKAFFKKVKLGRFDIVHSHPEIWFINLCNSSRPDSCVWIHTFHTMYFEEDNPDGLEPYEKEMNRCLLEIAPKADVKLCVSKWFHDYLLKNYSITTEIVPNGVDVEKFKPMENPTAVKRQFGLGNEPCVLFVGSLIPRKGLSFLVEAAKKIVKENADTKFLIVGEGPLKNQLTVSLESANLSGNFKFLGNLKEDALLAAYNCADVFVLPSIQEGQGIVLLEAQASGKPVVAFDVGGVNEAVRNKETGLLVKRGSSVELANALLRLLSDKSLREKMGANGRGFVSENFTWDICAQKMLKVYREALGN